MTYLNSCFVTGEFKEECFLSTIISNISQQLDFLKKKREGVRQNMLIRIQRGVLPFYNHFKHITTIRFLEEETRRCSTKYAYQACYVTDVLIRITLKTVLLVYGITEGKPPCQL